MSVKNILDQKPGSATFGKISRTYLPSAPVATDSQIYTVNGSVASANTADLVSGTVAKVFNADLALPQLPFNANYTKVGILIQVAGQGSQMALTGAQVGPAGKVSQIPFVVGWTSSVATTGANYATSTPQSGNSLYGSMTAIALGAASTNSDTQLVMGNILINDVINMPVGGLTGGTFNLQLYLGGPNLPAGSSTAGITVPKQTFRYTVSAWYVA